MTIELTLRPPKSDEYEAWHRLWDGYNAFYKRTGPLTVSEEMTRLTWDRFFDGYEPIHAIAVITCSQRTAKAIHSQAIANSYIRHTPKKSCHNRIAAGHPSDHEIASLHRIMRETSPLGKTFLTAPFARGPAP